MMMQFTLQYGNQVLQTLSVAVSKHARAFMYQSQAADDLTVRRT